MARTNSNPIKTNRWAEIRAFVAHRAGFRCEHCHTFLGMSGQADHVVPRSVCEDVGIHVYDHTNLQYLCTSCHSQKTNAERWSAASDGSPRNRRAKRPSRTKIPGRDRFMDAAGINDTLQHEENKC